MVDRANARSVTNQEGATNWTNATLTPLFKKKDRTQCNNYRGISLLSVPGKVLSLILLERLQVIIDPQCGFRKGRGTVDQIWVVRQIVVRATEYRIPLFLCFVDLTKAYDSVKPQAMTAILREEYGVPQKLVTIIEELHWCQVRSAGETSERSGQLESDKAVYCPPCSSTVSLT